MDIEFSEEQKILQRSARDFLADKFPAKFVRAMQKSQEGYVPELWKQMADLGWMGLAFPESYGGGGMKFLDLAVLLEEMGRACLTGPFFSTVVLCGLTILDAGTEKQKEKYLSRIINGSAIFTLALTEPSARYDAASVKTTAAPDGDAYVINGIKLFVPNANIADFFLCVARTGSEERPEDGITIFLVDAKIPGIKTCILDTIGNDKQCEVALNQVRVPAENILGQFNKGWNDVEKIIERAAIAKCCEMVGGMQRVLGMTVDYTRQRIQFQRPIGSFQAIQHHCSNIAMDVDSSRLAAYEAAWRMSEGLPCSIEAAIAKAWVSDAYRRVVILAEQIHGGVGIMADHDLPMYFRQAKAAELAFGDARYHRKTLARALKAGII